MKAPNDWWTRLRIGYGAYRNGVGLGVKRLGRRWQWRTFDANGGEWGFARTMFDAMRLAEASAGRRAFFAGRRG